MMMDRIARIRRYVSHEGWVRLREGWVRLQEGWVRLQNEVLVPLIAQVRRYYRRAIGVLVALATVAAVLAGMIHATSALGVEALQSPPAIVPTLPDVSHLLPPHDMLSVRGTHIVDGSGKTVTLLGATDFSLEFSCSGDGHFRLADFRAMRAWGMNTVRFTLSSAFWRNLDGRCPDYTGTVTAAVANAESAGLYVILTLQWDAPFSLPQDATSGGAQCPLPDANYDVRFWQDIAEIYQDDPRVIFDLFSEPHDIDWSEWESGGTITSSCFRYTVPYTYQAIGMPELASKVRLIAPSNLVILSGLGWGYDLSGIEAYGAYGSASMANTLYGTHPFDHSGGTQQPYDWPRAFGSLATHLPVIATEFGSYDCQTSYIAQEITYFKLMHMSFVAWAWTTGSCTIPSLLANWSGRPSAPYGVYIQQQIHALALG
jgi:hypothetical protein